MTSRTLSDLPPSPSKVSETKPVVAAAHAAAAPGGARWKRRLRLVGALLKETVVQWQDDEAPRLAASLSLYTLLSLAPLLIVSIAIAGMVLGEEAARGQISHQMSGVVGAQAGAAIEAMIANAREPSEGLVGSVVGIAVLLVGASGVFGELQTALNQIWNVKARPGRGVMGFVRDRFFSFSMVTGVAFLLLVSLVVSAVLVTVTTHFQGLIPFPELWQVSNIVISLAVTTLLFALIFKVVPDAHIAWRDVWVGAFVTAVLFSIGKILLGWYVGRSATVSPFGAAGSLVALIVWVYYSAQILFLGAEFAQVYATRFGSHIVPTANAVLAHAPEAAAGGAPGPASGKP
jgi:membrane protein